MNNNKIDPEKLGKILPFIPTRNIIVLEEMNEYIEIGRKASINTVNIANSNFGSEIVIIPQADGEQKEISKKSDLVRYGILAKIENTEVLNQNHLRINVRGIQKVEILTYHDADKNIFVGTFKETKPIKFVQNERNLYKIKKLHGFLYGKNFDNDAKNAVLDISKLPKFEVEDLTELKNLNQIIHTFQMPFIIAYSFFEQKTFLSKLDLLVEFFQNIFEGVEGMQEDISNIDHEIENDLRKSIDNQNKEFILREKLKVIRNKLGEDSSDDDRIEKLLNDQDLKNMIPEDVKVLIKKEKAKLKTMMSSSPDANITRNYIDLLTQLPWRKTSIEAIDIKKVKKILEEQHYGLKDVKERIIEFVAVMINNQKKHPDKYKKTKITDAPNTEINENIFVKEGNLNKVLEENSSPIITLLGPPGVGKTSIAKSLAESLGRKFVKISLGGVNDEAEIRGHRKTYVGAMPGKIINAIKRAGVSNPIILLDEIDKLGHSHKGDPSAALLEVLDPEQNCNFQDHYLEVEYDLSKVLFIATANYYEDIPTPLLDRVELIELSSYTLFEKINIAKKYLISRVIRQNGLEKDQFQINDENLEHIIRFYTLEAGVRNLQRVLDKIARKVALGIVEERIKDHFVIDQKIIREFLGVPKFNDDDKDNEPQIGCVNGLAYTSYGGSTLPIEVTTFAGKGDIKITGQLKDVMQESAQIALGYVRANAENFGIDFNFDESTIHIHVPEGAVPKDGPSAGVTFTTALISALSKKPVSHKVGMTGEITLRGKVLPIGGLKEKSLAALKQGIKTVFIPKDNEKNLEEVADEVKKEIEFIAVQYYNEIYDHLFKNIKSV